MAYSEDLWARIQEWKENLEERGEEKLKEIRRLVEANDIFEAYARRISQLPEEFRNSNLTEFIATCERNADDVMEGSAAPEPGVSHETENKSGMVRKPSAWANRLRNTQKVSSVPFTPSNYYRSTTRGNQRTLVMKTPAGKVRLPSAITPKVQDGSDVKFRTLRPEEVAFSVAGTPVIAADESESRESVLLMGELLHAREEHLTPESRSVVRGMKQLIDRIRPSGLPGHL